MPVVVHSALTTNCCLLFSYLLPVGGSAVYDGCHGHPASASDHHWLGFAGSSDVGTAVLLSLAAVNAWQPVATGALSVQTEASLTEPVDAVRFRHSTPAAAVPMVRF